MRLRWIALLGALAFAPPGADADPSPAVLVVVNANDATSLAIGEHYRAARGISADQVIALATETSRTISRQTFRAEIRDPLAAHLAERGWVDVIQFLVLAKGMPLRVVTELPDGSRWLDGREASVDAELSLLFSGKDGDLAFGPEPLANPYFDSDLPFATFRAAHPEAPLRYVVARLSGYSRDGDAEGGGKDGGEPEKVPADIARLIDGAQKPGAKGAYLIDEDPNQPAGRQWGNSEILAPAARGLRALGVDVVHDTSATFVSGAHSIAGYASWGSNDQQSPAPPYYGLGAQGLTPGSFAPRAIAVDLVSTNARSFAWPPEYGQSLIADLVALGAAGAAGHVFEPSLGRVARVDVLFHHYASGATAGEAFYRSLTHLGWVNLYVGDPLMVCDAAVASVCAAPSPSSAASVATALACLGWLAKRARRERGRKTQPPSRHLRTVLDPAPQ